MRRRHGPLFWVVLMAAQLLAALGTVVLGPYLDSLIFSGGDQGHGAPIFSVFLPLVALVVTAVVLIVGLIGLVRSLRRRRDREE